MERFFFQVHADLAHGLIDLGAVAPFVRRPRPCSRCCFRGSSVFRTCRSRRLSLVSSPRTIWAPLLPLPVELLSLPALGFGHRRGCCLFCYCFAPSLP